MSSETHCIGPIYLTSAVVCEDSYVSFLAEKHAVMLASENPAEIKK